MILVETDFHGRPLVCPNTPFHCNIWILKWIKSRGLRRLRKRKKTYIQTVIYAIVFFVSTLVCGFDFPTTYGNLRMQKLFNRRFWRLFYSQYISLFTSVSKISNVCLCKLILIFKGMEAAVAVKICRMLRKMYSSNIKNTWLRGTKTYKSTSFIFLKLLLLFFLTCDLHLYDSREYTALFCASGTLADSLDFNLK